MTSSCTFCSDILVTRQNFARCPSCGLIYNELARTVIYEEDYFNKEYKEQYGKSYFDDKENLQKRMKLRLASICKYTPLPNKRVLEIGSAAGFFLELCEKNNMQAQGWEVSKAMSEYANKNGASTKCGDFFTLSSTHIEERQEPYDLVCAYYVLEHLEDQKVMWQNLSSIIKPGGFLSLALPSSYGPMFYFQFDTWAHNHPQDHFVDYSPYSLRRIGELFGLDLVYAGIEATHPRRFLLPSQFDSILAFTQQITCFSDTLFAILQKNAT